MGVIAMLSHSEHFRPVRTGEEVMREGDSNNGKMFVVKEGQLRLTVFGNLTVDIGPGDIFGEMALLDNSDRIATVVALTDSRVVEIDRPRFLRLVQETPTFALEMMQVMADRLRRADRTIADRA